MSDRSAAVIEIGGEITDLDALVEAIEDEDLTDQWEGGWELGESAESHIWLRAQQCKPLCLMRHDVSGGWFYNLEAECRQQGLAYQRSDSGHYAYPPSHSAWQPGMTKPRDTSGASEEGPAISLQVLRTFPEHWTLRQALKQYDALDAPLPPISIKEFT